MKRYLRLFVGIPVMLLVAGSCVGCYKRTVAPTYTSEATEVLRIRQQLGAKTVDQEYINEEDEESED